MRNKQRPEVDFCDIGLVTTVLNTIATNYSKNEMDCIENYVAEIYESGRKIGDTVMRVVKMQEDIDQATEIISYSRTLLSRMGEESTYRFLRLITMCKDTKDSERALSEVSWKLGFWDDAEGAVYVINEEIERRLKA